MIADTIRLSYKFDWILIMSKTKAVTVNQMIMQLQQLKKEGFGEAKILVPIDDEFNDVRELYFTATRIDDEMKETINYTSPNRFDNLQKDYILIG